MKQGDVVVYYGGNRKYYGAFGTIEGRLTGDVWRVRFDGGITLFVEEKDLQKAVQSFDEFGRKAADM